ncbi:hypothetical protein BD311DRAFT_671180 [Dichomitus squalens]|uniref:SNF5-domain-containing protein n=1 Tax=Dichomitus squalens TaxID=114155 RepID=A0A4Q9MDM7_9APHY|nr:hypothetical protein BD311DRAFT_671180 [Dichomitus squalens]
MPIAPAPVPAGAQAPGSPHVGMKRKASETPAPARTSTPASGNIPLAGAGTPGPQMARTYSATGIAGMGITGNVGPAQQQGLSQNSSASSLMGGAGGGMMPPPVLPRQGQAGDGMNIGMGLRSTMPGQAQNVNANLVPGVGAGSPSASLNLGGLDGGSAVGPVPPQTPRQNSLPPAAASPYQQIGSPGVNVPGMIGGTPTKPVVVKPGTSPAPTVSPAQQQQQQTVTVTKTQIVPQLPPLPATVQLEQKVTQVSVVPLADSEKAIPPLSAEEIARVQAWQQADRDYEVRRKKMLERVQEEMKKTVSAPRAWWEKDFSLGGVGEEQLKRRRADKWNLTGLKAQKEREMKDKKRMGKREGLRLPRRISDEDAQRPEQLVPIRLEFDVEHHKMRDTFVWNLNDPIITPEVFAQSVVDDYQLTPSYHAIITKSIQEQLSDYKAHSATFGEDGAMIDEAEDIMHGKFSEEEAAWWEAWRKRVRSRALYKLPNPPDPRTRKRRKVVKDETVEQPTAAVPPSGDVPMTVDDFEEDENLMHEEMRILVKLDIIAGSYKLEDQFEWDLENVDPTPEQFAEIYCKDLGLGGEFKTAIAHSIREQVQIYQKSLFLVGHPSDGSAVQDDDLRMSLLPSLISGARSMEQVSAFTPQLNYLSESELEKNEKDREKELARRKRKTTRGRRGVALPDREPPKTYRTPAIGFPEISPAALALAAAAAAPTSRRAAAAAASLTIASMVASENRDDRDGALILPQTPITPIAPAAVATPAPPKEKKAKGLFKPPSYPSTVLRPRANVKAPTPSTAADSAHLPPPIENDLPAPSSSGIDRQGSKVMLTAKRAKELEREAKEKEYADGQHANMIDGVWHCSNCGCPESIAVGRRKGPLGDKSQCGTCGKYWHRHRRPRPVTYNSSLEYHMGLIRAEEQQKSSSKRKRPQSSVVEEAKSQVVDDEDMDTPAPAPPKSKAGKETSAAPDGVLAELPETAVSPVSTASSGSEPPLSHRIKVNGAHSKSAPPGPPEPVVKQESTNATGVVSPPAASPPRLAPSAPPTQNPPVGVGESVFTQFRN